MPYIVHDWSSTIFYLYSLQLKPTHLKSSITNAYNIIVYKKVCVKKCLVYLSITDCVLYFLFMKLEIIISLRITACVLFWWKGLSWFFVLFHFYTIWVVFLRKKRRILNIMGCWIFKFSTWSVKNRNQNASNNKGVHGWQNFTKNRWLWRSIQWYHHQLFNVRTWYAKS